MPAGRQQPKLLIIGISMLWAAHKTCTARIMICLWPHRAQIKFSKKGQCDPGCFFILFGPNLPFSRRSFASFVQIVCGFFSVMPQDSRPLGVRIVISSAGSNLPVVDKSDWVRRHKYVWFCVYCIALCAMRLCWCFRVQESLLQQRNANSKKTLQLLTVVQSFFWWVEITGRVLCSIASVNAQEQMWRNSCTNAFGDNVEIPLTEPYW